MNLCVFTAGQGGCCVMTINKYCLLMVMCLSQQKSCDVFPFLEMSEWGRGKAEHGRRSTKVTVEC